MAGDALKARLVAGAQELGIALDAVQAAALMRLLAELRDWNTRFNLTAIREPSTWWTAPARLLTVSAPAWARIADIGTGAGFPGLPLAVVNPRRSFTLIEATGKKVQFLRHAARRWASKT
jgi:16S rRNA (guanine527-N7)-methyltransferase